MIKIENNKMFGPFVTIYAANYNYSGPNKLKMTQGESREKTEIGDDCWLGTVCKILYGVKVGKGRIITAGAIVTNDGSEHSIAAGVPPKVIKQYFLPA